MLQAVVLNCTLKPGPEASNTEALAKVVQSFLEENDCKVEMVRVIDEKIAYGVSSEAVSKEDGWPALYKKIAAADILIVASPTWVGRPSSLAQVVIERLDGMISEKKADGRPLAYDKVAGVVVTGNEDGAHHVISEICGALVDIGFTIPPQAWTYWNKGPGPGKAYLESPEDHEWSHATGETAAKNITSLAKLLKKYLVGR
jgi:multimeric flavodoxin WrbA